MLNQSLTEYIKQSLFYGQTEEQIKRNLRQAGWQEVDIEKGMAAVSDGVRVVSPVISKFQLKKPEVSNISKAAWIAMKTSWQFWVLLAISLSLSLTLAITIARGDFTVVLAPFLIVILYMAVVRAAVRASFWRRFAGINGWWYKELSDPKKESGVMFRQGRNRLIYHYIEGSIDNRQIRIFNYEFSIESGRHRKTYYYTVFGFKFSGSFPHIYLNNEHNAYGTDVGEKISLPSEFEKRFDLFAPKKYEIEALEIFTPNVLADLLDNGFIHDVEFIDKEMLIFTDGRIDNFEELRLKFDQVLELKSLLEKKLDRIKFQPIGDMPHSL